MGSDERPEEPNDDLVENVFDQLMSFDMSKEDLVRLYARTFVENVQLKMEADMDQQNKNNLVAMNDILKSRIKLKDEFNEQWETKYQDAVDTVSAYRREYIRLHEERDTAVLTITSLATERYKLRGVLRNLRRLNKQLKTSVDTADEAHEEAVDVRKTCKNLSHTMQQVKVVDQIMKRQVDKIEKLSKTMLKTNIHLS